MPRPVEDIIKDHTSARAQNNMDRLRQIDAEARQRFDTTATTNQRMLDAGDLKASDQRTFDRNLEDLSQLKAIIEWGEQPATPRTAAFSPEAPARFGPDAGVPDLDGCVVGAAKGIRFRAADLGQVHDAARSRGVKNIISIAGAPQAWEVDPQTFTYDLVRDKMRLLDHMPVGFTDYPQTGYYRVTAGATAADTVAPGGTKPESTPTWEWVTSPVRKIAHWGKVHDEVVSDFNGFYEAVSNEYIAGLIDAETDQLLNGTGTAPDLRGILNTVGIQTQAFATNIITTLAKATTKLRTGTAKIEPDVYIVNADDWEAVTLFRTGGSTAADGPFLVDPFAPSPTSLWGKPVVVTTRIASGTAVVANLAMATRVRMRQAPAIEVAPGTGEAEWKTNITLIRAEERLGLEVPRPGAIVVATTVDDD